MITTGGEGQFYWKDDAALASDYNFNGQGLDLKSIHNFYRSLNIPLCQLAKTSIESSFYPILISEFTCVFLSFPVPQAI